MSSQPDRESIDVQKAQLQQNEFTNVLRALHVTVHTLPSLDEFPDSCFIEDIAVVVDHKAVICRPKYESRRGEERDVSEVLKKQGLTVSAVTGAGTIEGGDVIVTPRTLVIGRGKRTNQEGLTQFLQFLDGCAAKIIDSYDGVHLKSVATYIGRNTFVIDPTRVDPLAFRDFTILTVDPDESFAANCIAANTWVIVPAGFPKVVNRLRGNQFKVKTVDIDEFRKGDGSLTCLAVIWGE